MDEKELRKIKEELDALLSEEELKALKGIIQELKKHSSSFADLKKYLQNLLDLKKYSEELNEIKKYSKGFLELKKNIEASKLSKEQKVWFRDVLKAIKDLNKELPKEFEVIVKNYPKYPKKIEISNLKEFPREIRVSNLPKQKEVKFPESFKIKNLDKIKIPKKIEIKEPPWLKKMSEEELDKLLEALIKKIGKKGLRINLENYRDANKAIAVRLSNGRKFYEAIASIVTGSYGGPSASTTPFIYNVTLTGADTQYSRLLPANVRELRFRCRALFDVRYSFVAGKVAAPTAPYLTLPAGSDYFSDDNNLVDKTLYLASAEAGVVVEIEAWT